MKKILFILLFLPILGKCQFNNSKRTSPYKNQTALINFNKTQAYDLTKILPVGYVKDGSVDYTIFIQKGLERYKKVLMPNFPIKVSGIFPTSNSEIFFQKNSKLILSPTSRGRYQIIGIHGVENVKIYNPVLIGDRFQHLGTDGQWGFGIDIRLSRNVSVYNANVSDCWGDGIVITESKNGFTKKKEFIVQNILIANSTVDGCRRNGITITGGKQITLDNIVINNTFGTAPEAGIDIEPDNERSYLDDINLKNIKIFNARSGIQFSLNYYGSKIKNKQAKIYVSNLDIADVVKGVYVTGFHKKPDFKQIQGLFSFNNMITTDVDQPFVVERHFQSLPNIKIKDYNFNLKGKSYKNEPSALLKHVASSQGITYN